MAKKLKDLPINALVMDPNTKYYGKPIIWEIADKNHPGYPDNSVTLMSKYILCLKAFDAKEYKGENHRDKYGNNNWKNSNIRHWLNSNLVKWYNDGCYINENTKDGPPIGSRLWREHNPYYYEPGFLINFSKGFKNSILPTTISHTRDTLDGGGTETTTDKIFLASYTEAGFSGSSSAVATGSKLACFSDNNSRLKYPTAEAVSNSTYTNSSLNSSSPWWWWLRDSYLYSGYSCLVRYVYLDGSTSHDLAWNGDRGVCPICNMPSDILVSDIPNDDGIYELIFSIDEDVDNTIEGKFTIATPLSEEDCVEPTDLLYDVEMTPSNTKFGKSPAPTTVNSNDIANNKKFYSPPNYINLFTKEEIMQAASFIDKLEIPSDEVPDKIRLLWLDLCKKIDIIDYTIHDNDDVK